MVKRDVMRAMRTMLFLIVVLHIWRRDCVANAEGISTTSAELLQLYERAVETEEKAQIPDDVIKRAKEEINRIGTGNIA